MKIRLKEPLSNPPEIICVCCGKIAKRIREATEKQCSEYQCECHKLGSTGRLLYKPNNDFIIEEGDMRTVTHSVCGLHKNCGCKQNKVEIITKINSNTFQEVITLEEYKKRLRKI